MIVIRDVPEWDVDVVLWQMNKQAAPGTRYISSRAYASKGVVFYNILHIDG